MKTKEQEFHPDWDAMALMVEEQQVMAKRIQELENKKWVGLTDEERLEIIAVGGEAAVLYVTEAKLKEKNT